MRGVADGWIVTKARNKKATKKVSDKERRGGVNCKARQRNVDRREQRGGV